MVRNKQVACWLGLQQAQQLSLQHGEAHVTTEPRTEVRTRSVLLDRCSSPATLRGHRRLKLLKGRLHLYLQHQNRRAELCAHTQHTQVSGRMSPDVAFERG